METVSSIVFTVGARKYAPTARPATAPAHSSAFRQGCDGGTDAGGEVAGGGSVDTSAARWSG